MKFLFLIMALLLPVSEVWSASQRETVIWNGSVHEMDLLPFLSFTKSDPDSAVALDHLMDDASLTPLRDHPSLDFGYSQDTFWFRLNVLNQLDTAQDLVLGSTRPEHSYFTMHVRRAGKDWEHLATGSAVPMDQRPLYSRLAFAPLQLAAHERVDVLIELRSTQTLSLQFQIMTPRRAQQLEKIDDTSCFFYFGAITLLVLYSLFLGYSLRQSAYFYYALFGFSIGFTTFVYAGFFEVLAIKLPLLRGSIDTPRILLIPTIFAGLYCDRFFRLRVIAPRLALLSRATIYASVLAALSNMTPWGPHVRFLIPIFQLSNFINIFAMTFAALKERVPGARYQCAGWLVLFATNVTWILGNQGILTKNYAVGFAVLYGNIFEMLMGAIALGTYMRDLERRKFDAELKQKEAQHLQMLVFVVCHDIANPLTIIQYVIPLIRAALDGSGKLHGWLDKVEHASNIIKSIIQQVRRMESIRSGKYHPELEEVPVAFLFNELEFIFGERATQKDVRLVIERENLPRDLCVLAEQTSLLNDVLNNFVSNALKFSNHGDTIAIAASFDAVTVHIRIKDQGIGMSKTLIDKLFEAGASTSRRGTDNEVGTGFGMPLALYFVEKFGGRISVESQEKMEDSSTPHGTTITTSLPRAYPRAEAVSLEPERKELYNGKK